MATEVKVEEVSGFRSSFDRLSGDERLVGEIRVRYSRSMGELIAQLSTQLQAPVEEVLIQAVVLLQVAVDAQARGQRLCIIDDEQGLETEIDGFGTLPDSEPLEDQGD